MAGKSGSTSTLINIESLINSHDLKLTTLEKEQKTQRDMLKSLLDNNDEYQNLDQETKKIGKLRNIARNKVLSLTEAKSLLENIIDNQLQIKELKIALSDYLTQYVTLSGTNQIETSDGSLRQIVYTARLIRKKEVQD